MTDTQDPAAEGPDPLITFAEHLHQQLLASEQPGFIDNPALVTDQALGTVEVSLQVTLDSPGPDLPRALAVASEFLSGAFYRAGLDLRASLRSTLDPVAALPDQLAHENDQFEVSVQRSLEPGATSIWVQTTYTFVSI